MPDKPRRTRGKPRTWASAARTVRVNIRLTPAHHGAAVSAAARAGMSLSEWMARRIVGAALSEAPDAGS
jgi:predicted HicB family RNase H-like nuclease